MRRTDIAVTARYAAEVAAFTAHWKQSVNPSGSYIKLLHPVRRDRRRLDGHSVSSQVLVDTIHVGTSDKEPSVVMRRHSRWVGRRWTLGVGIVEGVEHEVSTIAVEPHPSEVVAFGAIRRRRRLHDLEAEDVAVKRERRRHVEDLNQRADAPHLESHESLAAFTVRMA